MADANRGKGCQDITDYSAPIAHSRTRSAFRVDTQTIGVTNDVLTEQPFTVQRDQWRYSVARPSRVHSRQIKARCIASLESEEAALIMQYYVLQRWNNNTYIEPFTGQVERSSWPIKRGRSMHLKSSAINVGLQAVNGIPYAFTYVQTV